jgi:hypothetical protein
MLKKILIVLVVAVGGFLAYAATRPDAYRVERTATMDAPSEIVFAQVEDFKAWAAWSPWEKMDPQMQKTFSDPSKGVGATYAWKGNDKVGVGKMTIMESAPPTRLEAKLEFVEPFESVARNGFTVASEGANASRVTWFMEGNNNLMGKVFGIFMNMDSMIGADFERGLAALKTVSEEKAREAEAARAAAEAAAAKARAEEEALAAAQAAAAKAAEEAAAAEAAKGAKKKRR